MKYCPVCGERYDEAIIRFCTKDGTPLIEEGSPSFTGLPSEPEDAGEETVIHRNAPVTAADPTRVPSERIVIPTTNEPEQRVRPKTQPAYYEPPRRSNTARTVILTVVGTLIVLGIGAILFKLFQKAPPSNLNLNVSNQNSNINSGFDSNFNFNMSGGAPSTPTNINTNVKVTSPTPTPRTTPTATPTPTTSNSASPTPRPTVSPRPSGSATPRPSASATPRATPRAAETNKASGLPINR